MRNNWGTKILFLILLIFIIISGFLIYVNWALKPLSEEKRNTSTTNLKMIVKMKDKANRTLIVRTYTEEEFNDLDEKEYKKVKDIVSGNIEGDIPALDIENNIGILEFSFEKTEGNNNEKLVTRVIPDTIPQIEISASSFDGQKEIKIINESLFESDVEGIYSFEINRYFKDFSEEEIELSKNNEFFMEFLDIKMNYEVDKQKYISIFALYSVEDKN